ncbi:hypothetical protein H2198_000197 [Neophaeococcomyces mojaviensis]|uniref:Uncharacterized protein n=1 Tax=Neophaeococcomyces mojaviensis TaxID=3383035 RepID=A0ACC3AKK9_9EURO|nr:hypothetical protein H2198_000197 [Knufia sp. JES_112]
MPIPPVFQSPSFPPIPHHQPSRPEGPPFEETMVVHQLTNIRGHVFKPDIIASIPKGFFQVDEKWTCYRRNYFSVSCAFTLKTHNPDTQCYLQRNNNNHAETISQWAVSITAKTAAANNNDSESRGLVQHTPKRDKATESVPTRHLVNPGPGQTIATSGNPSHNGIFASGTHLGSCVPGIIDTFGHPSSQSPPTQYTFERIQFQKATANNGKRRAQQQYFHVVVKLEANVGCHGGQDDWVVIATKQSYPMVVRGRSPGHYKDGRRDSQTSMDPDGNSGHSAEGGHSNFSMPSLGSNHTTSMSWASNQQRNGHQYGTPFSHRIDESDASSVSPVSSSTLASSPVKGENYHFSTAMGRTMVPETSFDRIVLSPIASKTNSDLVEYQHMKKQSFEDNASHCQGSFYQSSLDHVYHSPSFDFSATSTSQNLCASS